MREQALLGSVCRPRDVKAVSRLFDAIAVCAARLMAQRIISERTQRFDCGWRQRACIEAFVLPMGW
ncbi:hypothetical protein WT55_22800 [Burkholderia pseudomultivorans]|nr:hypothetical protein WT55_22800 [Burkholderia pseudomultivorans]